MAIKFELFFVFLLLSLLLVTEARRVGPCSARGNEGTRCTAEDAVWQRDGVCVQVTTMQGSRLSECQVVDTRKFRFRLVVRVQEKDRRDIENLWVRGSGPQLSWDKQIQLRHSALANSWVLDISYSSDSDGILCSDSSHCAYNQKAIEIRFSISEDGYDDMKGPNIYIPLPVSKSMEGALDFVAPRVEVFPWFHSTTVRPEEIQLSCSSIICGITSPIRSTILYPPSFNFNIARRYPLIIMFGAIEASLIIPLLEHMYAYEASIEEAMVVSIHYLDTAPFCEFNPYTQVISNAETSTIWRCRPGDRQCFNCQNCWDTQRPSKCSGSEFIRKAQQCLFRYPCEGTAGDILDFIELSLLPELQERTQNRLKLDFPRERMSVIGFSGAGLLACHAALSRPWYYANAACMSATFHWPLGISKNVNNRSSEGISLTLSELALMFGINPEKKGLYMTQKYYIDNGEQDNFYLPIIDAHDYSRWMLKLLTKTLPLPPENILYFNIPNAGNDDVHFSDAKLEVFQRIKQPLIFFLKSPGGPNKDFTRTPRIDESVYTNNIPKVGQEQRNTSTRYNQAGPCAFRRRPQTGIHPQVFVISIVIITLLSVGLTFAFMFLRELNMKAKQTQKEEQQQEVGEDGDTDIEDMKDFEKAKNASVESLK